MPLIKSVTELADGWEIVTADGGSFAVGSADLPNQLKNKTLAEVEAWCNAFLSAAKAQRSLGGLYFVRLTSVVPLNGSIHCNDDVIGAWTPPPIGPLPQPTLQN